MSSSAISDVNLYANPDNLTWGDTSMDFKQSKATQCHVLAEHLSTYQNNFSSANVTFVGDLQPLTPAGPVVDINDAKTTASFTMPASDVTVNYTLVRDMQDATNPVAFTGLPTTTTDPIIVKKGDDGKYQPAEELNIQLIDPLAAAEAQNIIDADGITIKVLVGAVNEQGAIDYEQDNPKTLEAFLADMKPGYYWIKAESTDENSSYEGTVYSSEFTVEEKYDLTVKPADDFSKTGLESFTVGTEQPITPDVTTGKATKTGIAPETEVKLKAKRGYIIEKAETKKGGDAPEYYDQLSAGYNVTINVINSNVWSQNIFGQVGFTSSASGSIWNAMTITKEQAIALAEYKGSTSLVLYDKGEGSDDGYGGKNVLYKFAKSDGTTVDIERSVNIKNNPSILQGYTVYYIPKNAN